MKASTKIRNLSILLLVLISFMGLFAFTSNKIFAFEPDNLEGFEIAESHKEISLRDSYSSDLQSTLMETLVEDKKMKQLIDQGKISIGLVDLKDERNIRFAHVNGDKMMYAASLPKIGVLLAAMDAIEKGELIETSEIKRDMFLMINKSNNQATTRMIDRLGLKKIEQVLTDPNYLLYDKKTGGGIWVGKRYAKMIKRNPDPLKGLSHAASATQVARFYYMMLNGQLVNENRSKQMMDIMVDPGLHHKFVNTLDKVAPNAKVYRKSGSWKNFHSDSVMVLGDQRKYILVAISEDKEGERNLRNLVHKIEDVLDIGSS